MKHILIILTLCAISLTAHAQRDSLNVFASSSASIASNHNIRPLLSYSNQWGEYTQFDHAEALIATGLAYRHTFRNPRLTFSAGFSAQLSTDSLRTMLSQLYANFQLLMFDVRLGLENYTPIETNWSTAIGSFLMSNNARPYPRAWAGILRYWSIPLNRLPFSWASHLENILQIRGGLSFAHVDDEGRSDYTDNVLLHEKFAYARIGRYFLKPYVGLYHSVCIGGTLSNGTKIPVDFINSFLGKRGDPEIFGNGKFRGETTNAAGGHQGLWDLGVDIALPFADAKVYYQQPFVDSKTIKPIGHSRTDLQAGILVHPHGLKALQEFSIEFITTKWCGGEGIPDPLVPNQKGGYTYLYPSEYDTNDIPHLKQDVLLSSDVAAWEATHGEIKTHNDIKEFFQATYNHDCEYGGRLLYLENYCLEQGWTHAGLSTGAPLLHTNELVSRYAPQGTMPLKARFPNIRIRAFNFGLRGQVGPILYNFRLTASHNYGNFREKYIGEDPSSSWNPQPNYLFATTQHQTYSRLSLAANITPHWQLSTSYALDLGDLYKSFSARLSILYHIPLP